jgi:hypothetical protein
MSDSEYEPSVLEDMDQDCELSDAAAAEIATGSTEHDTEMDIDMDMEIDDAQASVLEAFDGEQDMVQGIRDLNETKETRSKGADDDDNEDDNGRKELFNSNARPKAYYHRKLDKNSFMRRDDYAQGTLRLIQQIRESWRRYVHQAATCR